MRAGAPEGGTEIEHLWAPWRMEYVSREGTDTSGCFLCQLAASTESAVVVDRTDLSVTCLNRFPYNTGHLLVAPRRHLAEVTMLRGDEGLALGAATQRAVRALTAAMRPDGFNIGVNQGRAAGASIEHLHVHVVPRWSGDTNFMPVVAGAKVLPEHLVRTGETLRQAFMDLDAEQP